MQAVFTIVAKNYIPLANVLGDSLHAQHPEIDFLIFVADREDGLIKYNEQRYPTIAAEKLSIDRLIEMAFKYNITEFCTSIKPFCFKYLFATGYDKVIYFDPDIFIFDRLDKIFSNLDQSSMIVTPHFSTPEEKYTGVFREGNILFAGIFNLGFCALKNSHNGNLITNWWCKRLEENCYADRTDGFHVDQKWVDFLPSFFDDIKIEKGLGYNVAIWNWHERKISYHNNKYWVSNRILGGAECPLIFYHYSNYKFKSAGNIEMFMPLQLTPFADILTISEFYSNLLVHENVSSQLVKLEYSYAKFDNGIPIVNFHRRFYRRILDAGQKVDDPFQTQQKDSFFAHLQKSRLLSKSISLDKLNENNFEGFDRKLNVLNQLAKLIVMTIGFDRYALLCKFMYRYVRPENQVFMMKGYKEKIPFLNENRYINLD